MEPENIWCDRPRGNAQDAGKSLRAQLHDFIRANPHCTFRDVEALPGCRGDQAFMYSQNVLLWPGLSAAAGAALSELLRRGVVEIRGPDFGAYVTRRPGEARVRAIELPKAPIATNRDAAVAGVSWFPATLHVCDGWAVRADEAQAH